MENIVGQKVKNLREKLMLSQRAFASKLGVSSTAISQIENGGGVTGKLAKRICEAYKVNPEWLLYGRGEMFLEDSKKENKDIKDVKEKLIEFKGFLKALLQLEHQEKLWEKIEPNFPKCKQAV